MIFLKELKINTSSIITISKVILSRDMKIAKVYLSIYNKDEQNITKDEFNNIKNNKNILKFKVGNTLSLKYMPDIRFFLDDQYEFLDKIIRVNKK